MIRLEQIVQYLDSRLEASEFPDYDRAVNGLQVSGPGEVRKVAAAVDAGEPSLRDAREAGCDLLLVHHGLFWGGSRPITGPLFRKVSELVQGGVALYSSHLPLDAHPEVGNCALLTRALGLEPSGAFGEFQGRTVGWWAECSLDREALRARVAEAVDGPVRVIAGGPDRIRRVGVVTGGGGAFIGEAARRGLDALVTGEGAHHTYLEALEQGVDVYYAGHYATETFGVRALARELEEEFGLPWIFIDHPSGL